MYVALVANFRIQLMTALLILYIACTVLTLPHTPTHTRTVVAETGIVQLPSKKVPTVEAAKVETEGPKEARTVFVSNLSFKATEDELREIFTPVSVEIT